MRLLSVLPLMIVNFSIVACKKEIETETVTVNGLTFGCKVNGKPFIADNWDYGYNIPPVHIGFWWDPIRKVRYLKIRGERENESIFLYLNSPIITGRKLLNTQTISWPCNVHPADYGSYSTRYPSKEFITNTITTGFVDIIYVDTTTNKIEARFEFTGSTPTGEKVQGTNGFFKNF